jgi:2'-phosphotransferase
MAAAVLSPLSTLALSASTIVLPPSSVVQHSPRHGRSRGASFKGGKGGARYNVVEDPDNTLYKALMFVLKRAVQESELEEDVDEEDAEILIRDAEGWVDLEDVVSQIC